VIGSGNFIPGFEENLIGGKVGDDMAFDITFPKDYHSPDFQGRKVHFTAKIEKIEKPHTPAFDEDFIEQLRGKRTDLAGLKDILRDEIKVRKESEVRNKDEDVLMKQILEITKFDVGPALISSEIEQIYREHGANLEQQGLSLAQYLEHIKQSPEVYKETVIKPEAERRLKAELILRRIKEMRGTEASDEEIKAEVEKVIAQYGSPEVVERLKAKLVPGDGYYEDIKSRVTYRKVVNEFFE
jgi:trigger factor